MKQNLVSKKEIRFLFITFLMVISLMLISKAFSFYQMQKMHEITKDIFKHPLKVSNAALKIELEEYKVHRNMKDIVLATSKDEIADLVKEVNLHEKKIYESFNVIQENILDEEGIKLHNKTKALFLKCKLIRDEVITLAYSGDFDKAIEITNGIGTQHIEEFEKTSHELYIYAQNKANVLIGEYDSINHNIELIKHGSFLSLLLVIFIFMYYSINRISKYMYKNEYLNRITTIIKELDKLIIREKDSKVLLEKSCKILASNDVYKNAWAILLNEKNEIEYFTSPIETNQFIEFKNRLENNWFPKCIKTIMADDDIYNVYKSSKKNCDDCPIFSIYNGSVIFNIKLSYKEVVYGYLTIAVEETFLDNKDEISLLKQYVNDMSYALYNIKTQQNLSLQQNIYKELFENTQSAIVVYNSPDDGDTFIISDLNSGAESIEHINKEDVIGKDVKELFPAIDEFGLLEVFKKVYQSGVSQKFDLKEYKDERISGWRENYVYKLSTNGIVAIYSDRTLEKNFQDTLFKIEELYDNIINSVDNLIFAKDNDFKYIACNKSFEKFLGLTKDEIIGKSDYDFFDKKIADEFRMYDEVMLKNNESKSNFEWVTYSDGSKVYLYTTKSPLLDSNGNTFGLVGVSADFTIQKHTEEALNKSKIRYETAEKIGKVGSWEYIIKTKEFWASKESKIIYGLPVESISFSTEQVESCVPDRERVHQALVDLLEKNKDYNLEFEINPFDGSAPKIISSIAKVEFDEDGEPERVIGFIQDITEMKEKDQMIINQSRHAAMGEMISMIAHQWRQPLSIIAMDANNMIVDIALDELEPKKAQMYSESIIEQTQHLSETINDFRNFFKPDKDMVKISISTIIEETYAIVRDSLKNNDIEFKSFFESNTEVLAFERELMQVFVNIISNAKDTLINKKVDDPWISVKVYDDERYVNAEICDNGGGIDLSIIDKIFDPYFTTKDEMTGTGLGLYMSKMIVEEHLNGIIEVKNIEDGACFRVRLFKAIFLKTKNENINE